MQGSARKDVVFGAARVYTFTVPGPKWKSWFPAVFHCHRLGSAKLGARSGPAGNPGPHARSAHAIDIDADSLSNGPDRLWLDVPGRPSVLAESDDFKRRGNGGLVWRGKLQFDSDSQVVLTRHKGLVVGTIWVDDKVYEIRPGPGGQSVVSEVDPASFPPCSDSPDLPPGAAADLNALGGFTKSLEGDAATAKAADPGAEMHLLAMYTPQARDAEGGVAQIEALIQAAVDNANTALINSDMIGRYVLVHTALANYNDSGNLSTDLNWVDSDAAVAALRNQHGADMVSLVVNSGGCGIGYVQRSPGSSFASFAFQVTVRDCAVGNLTFAHEHGHNLGFEHDPANGPSPSIASYPWSFGYYIGGGSARTVMAYPAPCSSCPRVMHFSNPGVTYGGLVTGVHNVQDNARTGDLTAPIVHNFRSAVYIGGSSSQSFQDGVSPTTGYAGTTDAYLSENNPNSNLGASAELRSDGDAGSGLEDRAVLRWDTSQIPVGAVVKSVHLNITINNSSGNTYHIYALNRTWTENQVTWNQAASGTPWEIAGASGLLDRDGTLLGMIPVAANGTIGATLNDDGVAAVQSWVNNPSSNAGLIVVTTGGADGVYFRSSEYATAGERPRLTVSYDPPATNTPPQFGVDPIVKSDAEQDSPYSDSLAGSATDADFDPLTYEKISGPAWLSVAGNGVLSGTPTSADLGPNSFTVGVSDGRGGSDTAALDINVVAPVTLDSITLNPTTATIEIGATDALTATGHYSDTSTQDLTGTATWISLNEAVATVASGVVTGVSQGSAGITASFGGVTSLAAFTTVPAPTLDSITVSPPNASVEVGNTQAFTATANYSDLSAQDVTATAVWASSNTGVATMSGATATGVAAGNTGITAAFGGLTSTPASLEVTAPVTLESVTVTPASISVQVGNTQAFTATANYSDSSTQDVTATAAWASSNTGVATMSGAVATGVAVGNTGITASFGGLTSSPASLAVTAAVTLESITLTPSSASISAGGTQAFTATGNYSDLTTQNLTGSATWASSNTGVATMSGNVANGVSAGSSNITASFDGVTSSPAALTVTVFNVTGMLPNIIQAGLQSPVTITGTGFVAGGAALIFQNGSGHTPVASNVVVASPNQITAILSVSTKGPKRNRQWEVVVQNGDGQTDLVPGGLTVTLNPIPNNPPVVAITSPSDGSSFAEGANVGFTGTANDVENGDLTGSLSWTSSIDGPIGSGGGSVSAFLSPGNHTITASVTDLGGQSGSSAISITVGTPNTAPEVTITAPSNGSSVDEGTSIGFVATATDNEDGNVAASLSWSSNLQGNIGSGASFNAVLNPGTHTITATATDGPGLTGQDSISVTVNSTSAALSVTGISPSPVSRHIGTTNFTISGTGFVNGANVGFENGRGQTPRVNSVTWISATELVANVQIRSGGPNRVRFWDVRVTNSNNDTAVGAGSLQLNP